VCVCAGLLSVWDLLWLFVFGVWLWSAFLVVMCFVCCTLLVGISLFIQVCGEFVLLGSVLRCVFYVCVLCFCGLLVFDFDDVGCVLRVFLLFDVLLVFLLFLLCGMVVGAFCV